LLGALLSTEVPCLPTIIGDRMSGWQICWTPGSPPRSAKVPAPLGWWGINRGTGTVCSVRLCPLLGGGLFARSNPAQKTTPFCFPKAGPGTRWHAGKYNSAATIHIGKALDHGGDLRRRLPGRRRARATRPWSRRGLSIVCTSGPRNTRRLGSSAGAVTGCPLRVTGTGPHCQHRSQDLGVGRFRRVRGDRSLPSRLGR